MQSPPQTSNEVAVGVDDNKVFAALQKLAQEFGIAGKNPVKYRNNTVAVKLDDNSFFTTQQLLA